MADCRDARLGVRPVGAGGNLAHGAGATVPPATPRGPARAQVRCQRDRLRARRQDPRLGWCGRLDHPVGCRRARAPRRRARRPQARGEQRRLQPGREDPGVGRGRRHGRHVGSGSPRAPGLAARRARAGGNQRRLQPRRPHPRPRPSAGLDGGSGRRRAGLARVGSSAALDAVTATGPPGRGPRK